MQQFGVLVVLLVASVGDVLGDGKDCVDEETACTTLAMLGYCEGDAVMQQRCRKSCKTDHCAMLVGLRTTDVVTGNDCVDDVPTCPKLAESGYCERNKIVKQRCRKSCKTGDCE